MQVRLHVKGCTFHICPGSGGEAGLFLVSNQSSGKSKFYIVYVIASNGVVIRHKFEPRQVRVDAAGSTRKIFVIDDRLVPALVCGMCVQGGRRSSLLEGATLPLIN